MKAQSSVAQNKPKAKDGLGGVKSKAWGRWGGCVVRLRKHSTWESEAVQRKARDLCAVCREPLPCVSQQRGVPGVLTNFAHLRLDKYTMLQSYV
eukprot:6204147-Pleurochrysis_carterae.AAC.3